MKFRKYLYIPYRRPIVFPDTVSERLLSRLVVKIFDNTFTKVYLMRTT